MTRIKFCGIRSDETIPLLNGILPDYAGFILSPRFWRYITPKKAEELRGGLDCRIKTVGVFVDNPIEEVESILRRGIVDIAQLHGSESGDYIRRLQESTGKKIIKAFKVTSREILDLAAASPADWVLLDSGTGTGERFEWSLGKGFDREYFLAGGLDPDNVSEAVRLLHPFCVDVSSGIETDRVKDGEKMRRFADAVRKCDI